MATTRDPAKAAHASTEVRRAKAHARVIQVQIMQMIHPKWNSRMIGEALGWSEATIRADRRALRHPSPPG